MSSTSHLVTSRVAHVDIVKEMKTRVKVVRHMIWKDPVENVGDELSRRESYKRDQAEPFELDGNPELA